MSQPLQIAIDGPAGAGKSTIAKVVATRLGLLYLDTGAMYRAIAYKAIKEDIPINHEASVSLMTKDTMIEFEHSSSSKIWCDGQDITEAIRSPEVTKAVSLIARYPSVREHLVNMQRREAKRGGVVMDGRDIGTNVLPDAPLKIFLTASIQERARRRWVELNDKGIKLSIEQVKRDIAERDSKDSAREVAPLRPAPDAVIIDTTELSIEQIVDKIIELTREV